jgi:hypothetical protein
MLDIFIEEKDVSIQIANAIEVTLDELFPDDPYLQDTVILLAHYRPGGGEFLVDTAKIMERLRRTKVYMQKLDVNKS